MWRCRRRRIYSIFAFISIACTIFICFQFFSVQMLDSYAERNSQKNKQIKFELDKAGRPILVRPGDDYDAACVSNCSKKEFGLQWENDAEDDNIEDHLPKLVFEVEDDRKKSTIKYSRTKLLPDNNVQKQNLQRQDFEKVIAEETALKLRLGMPIEKNVWKLLEQKWPTISGHGLVGNESHIPRGVYTAWSRMYDADVDGLYTCILSTERIPFAQINDDYCDCSDTTDEPGTDACPAGRFYCRYQSLTGNPRWLPSSRVNDGVCDCCDGTDEWKNVPLPDHVAINDGAAHYNIHQVPCLDRCQELRHKDEAMSALRRQGARLKKDYIDAARGQNNPEKIYGSDAAFFKLSQQCWTMNIGQYAYSICPFKETKQRAGGHETIIGRNPRWLSQGPISYQLILYDGDSTNCPEQNPRTTKLEFECGIKDEIVSISENEVCCYVVRFITPAACHQ